MITQAEIDNFYLRVTTAVSKAASSAPAYGYHLLALWQDAQLKPLICSAPGSVRVAYHHAYVGGWLDHVEDVLQNGLRVAGGYAQGVTNPGGGADTWTLKNGHQVTALEVCAVAILHDFYKVCDPWRQPNYVPNFVQGKKKTDPPLVQSTAIPFKRNPDAFAPILADDVRDPNRPQLNASRRALLAHTLPRAAGGEKSLAVIAALAPELHAALPPQVVNAILYHDGLYGENADQVYGNETPLQIIMHFADMMSSRLARPPKAVEPE